MSIENAIFKTSLKRRIGYIINKILCILKIVLKRAERKSMSQVPVWRRLTLGGRFDSQNVYYTTVMTVIFKISSDIYAD